MRRVTYRIRTQARFGTTPEEREERRHRDNSKVSPDPSQIQPHRKILSCLCAKKYQKPIIIPETISIIGNPQKRCVLRGGNWVVVCSISRCVRLFMTSVSGIWYLVYCTSPIAYPIVNGYSPSGTWGPRTSTGGLVIVLRARVPPYLYGESVRGRSRHYGNLCVVSALRTCFLTAWSTVVAVYAGG